MRHITEYCDKEVWEHKVEILVSKAEELAGEYFALNKRIEELKIGELYSTISTSVLLGTQCKISIIFH